MKSLSRSGLLHKSCPVCGCATLQPRWQVDTYSIVRCAGCSLVFVQDALTRDELAAHYASGGDPVYSDDGNRECLDYYYNRLRERIESRVPVHGRILDVGCSQGWFLEAMKGWDCYGCEIVPPDAELARRRFGGRIFTGALEEYPLDAREGFFDVITLQDVFDHCPEPLGVLQKCRRMLKSGGLLVIKVHNISCLYARLTGPGFYAVIPPSHLFYYNRKTLSLAVGKAGFQVVESRFIAHLLRISTIFIRLARGNNQSVFHRIHAALVGSPLGRIKIRKNLHDIITIFAVKQGE